MSHVENVLVHKSLVILRVHKKLGCRQNRCPQSKMAELQFSNAYPSNKALDRWIVGELKYSTI